MIFSNIKNLITAIILTLLVAAYTEGTLSLIFDSILGKFQLYFK